MLFLDGVYVDSETKPFFKYAVGPNKKEITHLTSKIALRIMRLLMRAKLIEQDTGNSYLSDDFLDANALTQDALHSITYKIAVGPNKGKKVLTLKTLLSENDFEGSDYLSNLSGFSLHAGVAALAHQRKKLERICRYISRPALSDARLSVTCAGQISYELKMPYRNGTTHILFEPLDFISKLAALIPKPYVNLVRFHGAFAPNSSYRRSKDLTRVDIVTEETPEIRKKRGYMTWAQRLQRVFNIDITRCSQCLGVGVVKVIACITDPTIINKILTHLHAKLPPASLALQIPSTRAPPIECF